MHGGGLAAAIPAPARVFNGEVDERGRGWGRLHRFARATPRRVLKTVRYRVENRGNR